MLTGMFDRSLLDPIRGEDGKIKAEPEDFLEQQDDGA